MTTIIREQNMVYTDSCITTTAGTETTRIFGAMKLFVTQDRKLAMGICGSIPEYDASEYISNVLSPMVSKYLANFMVISSQSIVKAIKGWLKQQVSDGNDFNVRCTLIFFSKTHTYQISIRHNKRLTRIDDFTMQANHPAVYGSGAAWYLAQKDIAKLTIAERFAAVYQTDPSSGGPVHAFDLNQLKDL